MKKRARRGSPRLNDKDRKDKLKKEADSTIFAGFMVRGYWGHS